MIEVNGDTHPWREGMTVADLLEEKRYTFPMKVVRMDGRLVRKDEYDRTPVPDGARVAVIHLTSGG